MRQNHNQDEYQTLGWIINQSEQGLYLAIADEEIQQEIIGAYRHEIVGIYDYRQYPGAYSFPVLEEWMKTMPEIQTFFIANLQFAVQSEKDLKRLNFSRDLLAGLEKNIIFLTTPYVDDRLATVAYDFYSFIKIRIIFHSYEREREKQEERLSVFKEILTEETEWTQEEAKQKLKESNVLLEQAIEKCNKARYDDSEVLLLKAESIRKKLLGEYHSGMMRIYSELAFVYLSQYRYEEAEMQYMKALAINKNVWGEEHPSTAMLYHNLAYLYSVWGRYEEAELYGKKAQERPTL